MQEAGWTAVLPGVLVATVQVATHGDRFYF